MSHSGGNKIRFSEGGAHLSALTRREKKNQCWGVAVKSTGQSFRPGGCVWFGNSPEVWIITAVRNHSVALRTQRCVAVFRVEQFGWIRGRVRPPHCPSFWLEGEGNNPISSYYPSFDSVCVGDFFFFFFHRLFFLYFIKKKKQVEQANLFSVDLLLVLVL